VSLILDIEYLSGTCFAAIGPDTGVLGGPKEMYRAIAISPDGATLAIGVHDRGTEPPAVQLFDVKQATRKASHRLRTRRKRWPSRGMEACWPAAGIPALSCWSPPAARVEPHCRGAGATE